MWQLVQLKTQVTSAQQSGFQGAQPHQEGQEGRNSSRGCSPQGTQEIYAQHKTNQHQTSLKPLTNKNLCRGGNKPPLFSWKFISSMEGMKTGWRAGGHK